MATHWFADESKRPGYLMVAAVAESRQLVAGRSALSQILLPHQRRLHFTKEHDNRRDQILAVIAACGIQSIVYDASEFRGTNQARKACLERILEDAAAVGAIRLVIESDVTTDATDREVLYAHMRKIGCRDQPTYEHAQAAHDPLLWIADGVAWCWAKGNPWRNKVRPLVADYHILVDRP